MDGFGIKHKILVKRKRRRFLPGPPVLTFWPRPKHGVTAARLSRSGHTTKGRYLCRYFLSRGALSESGAVFGGRGFFCLVPPRKAVGERNVGIATEKYAH